MSTTDATRFLEAVSKDRSVVEKVPAPSQLKSEDIIKIGANLGYHFSADELNKAVESYLTQHAAELNTADLEYLKAAGGC